MSLGEFKGRLNALPIGAPKTNKKALIPLGIRAFPKLAFSSCGADGTLTYTIKKSHKIAIY